MDLLQENETETKFVSYIRITNVPKATKEKLHTISENMGITMSAFLKSEIRKIIDQYPQHLTTKRF